MCCGDTRRVDLLLPRVSQLPCSCLVAQRNGPTRRPGAPQAFSGGSGWPASVSHLNPQSAAVSPEPCGFLGSQAYVEFNDASSVRVVRVGEGSKGPCRPFCTQRGRDRKPQPYCSLGGWGVCQRLPVGWYPVTHWFWCSRCTLVGPH